MTGRRLERRLPVRGLERGPGCHPERSAGALRPASQALRCAQGDRHGARQQNVPVLDSVQEFVPSVVDVCRIRKQLNLEFFIQSR
jgi:hypothetical protein